MQSYGLKHARFPWPSLSPGVCSNSCPLSLMPSNHLILCHHLLLLTSIFLSIRVFSNELMLCIRWQKYWNFSFRISPFSEYSGLISFRIDWLDLFAVQGTLKSLLQHHLCLAGVREVISWPHFANEETETRKRKYLSQGHAESRKVKPGLNSTA